jgi:hypothetical protein
MSKELIDLLIQVIRSWQVLAVTGVLIVYFLLISNVTRKHHRPRMVARTTRATKGAPPPVGEPDVETTDNDDLGLEEE